ncbi:MAG: AI-2E family transporter [Deltaproteobacteria bacterium]
MLRAHLTDRNVRRAFVLALFLGLLVLFRHLLLLLVFFVVFERLIGLAADYLHAATRLKFKYCVLIVVSVIMGIVGTALYAGVSVLVANVPTMRRSAQTVIDTIRQSAVFARVEHAMATVSLLEKAREHAGTAVHVAAAIGRDTLYVFIGLVFAVVFLLERDDLENWREKMPFDSVPRILLRNMGHVADAIAITLKLQLIVAVVSTLITLPVLLALRLPGIPALVAMLLVTGLIPIVGGPVAGTVLMTLAYVTRGPGGLAVFVTSTFILHKIESYYLTPRLTAKHVKLPSFVIITSLVLFEHVFGLIGLFLSFPVLYVAAKIREGWIDPDDEVRDDEAMRRAMRGVLPSMRGFRLKPGAFAGFTSTAVQPTDGAAAGEATPRVEPPGPETVQEGDTGAGH